MNRGFALAIAILGVLSAAVGTARADAHAVVESTRLYMDQETKVTFEYWIAPDRSSRSASGRVTITRGDLGLAWDLDLNARSYTESVIQKPQSPPSRQGQDMRKLWLDFYEPEFDWTVRETGASRSFIGFDCREFRASGEADFAEMSAVYWICLAPDVPGAKAFHDYSLTQYRGVGRMTALSRLLEENPDGICAYREEAVENSIAPTVRATTSLTKLEEAEAPPGTYDIPAGFKKLAGRGDG
jgi:hypothetical protein